MCNRSRVGYLLERRQRLDDQLSNANVWFIPKNGFCGYLCDSSVPHIFSKSFESKLRDARAANALSQNLTRELGNTRPTLTLIKDLGGVLRYSVRH
jgi:hypothetical protein